MATQQPTQNNEDPQAQQPAPSSASTQPTEISENNIYVSLTHSPLDYTSTIDRVRSPEAGAIVIFAGTTRNNFNNLPVQHLSYTSYAPLALRTMLTICRSMVSKHGLKGIAMVHRLGVVPIGEESILIAVSSPHRQAAWRAGEEALEECKEKVEVWKREEFGGEEGGVWRANRDGKIGVRVDKARIGGGDGRGEKEEEVKP
ncbi:Molybdopterin biosynthesis MoaE [Sordaria brevicollis]|uniref:Molybdopterin synthase catalytic subunit n=1 Tax=Sordaria brevicollis TaxID=83679 RepID=A0AAE0PDH5_SORBR|nr:Molybdopterin biosynthesis MoaE [Sordaria brevicollis]